MKTFVSELSGKRFPINEKISGTSVRAPVMRLIREEHPDFDAAKSLSLTELNTYREQYIAASISRGIGQMSALENKVLESITERSIASTNPDETAVAETTFGQRVADRVASFGGSWTFIITFVCVLLAWIAVNAFWLMNKGFDPYPFILLNLLLSCLAALQAPVIMMSQNRQAEKDRSRAKEDYVVNLKSELEVRALHEKLDHLMMYQQQELIEIQKIQIDMLNDILKKIRSERKAQKQV